MKIPSFIVTLAGMLVFKGLSLALLGGMSVGPFPREFQLLSAGFIPDVIGPITLAGVKLHSTTLLIGVAIVGSHALFQPAQPGQPREPRLRSRAFRAVRHQERGHFSDRAVPGLHAGVLQGPAQRADRDGLLIALFVFITKRTTIGRRIYAMGGNEKAAKLSGIKTERLTFYIFIIMGMLAALAGLIFAARLNTATPKAGWASSST